MGEPSMYPSKVKRYTRLSRQQLVSGSPSGISYWSVRRSKVSLTLLRLEGSWPAQAVVELQAKEAANFYEPPRNKYPLHHLSNTPHDLTIELPARNRRPLIYTIPTHSADNMADGEVTDHANMESFTALDGPSGAEAPAPQDGLVFPGQNDPPKAANAISDDSKAAVENVLHSDVRGSLP